MTGLSSLSEKHIQRACLNWLLRNGIFAWRNGSTGLFDREKGFYRTAPKRGAPDIIAIRNGRFIGIEVKSAKGKLRPEQEAFKVNVEAAGGVYMVVRSLEDLKTQWDML